MGVALKYPCRSTRIAKMVKVVAAYLLATLGGKDAPSASDITNILSAGACFFNWNCVGLQ